MFPSERLTIVRQDKTLLEEPHQTCPRGKMKYNPGTDVVDTHTQKEFLQNIEKGNNDTVN